MRITATCLMIVTATGASAQQLPNVQHFIAAIEPGKFHGWPANNGAWQWGDEILVGFTQGEFDHSDGHNLKGIQHSEFARSLDGGETWTMFDPDNFLDDDNIKWLPAGKTVLTRPMDFNHDGFALRIFAAGYHGNDDPEGGFYYSYDRGATWNGPHSFGDLNDTYWLNGMEMNPRTNYIITGPRSCYIFITARTDRFSRVACIKTENGSLDFEFVSWVTPKSNDYTAIMPQTIRRSNGDYILAFRKIFRVESEFESAIDVYISEDRCESWRFLSTVKKIKDNSNPPSIVDLADGRLCCVYGDRDEKRMAGKYSSDGGRTWGEEFIIRDNYRSVDDWADMGYPRMVMRADGKLAVMYYWAIARHPEQFIACSVWRP